MKGCCLESAEGPHGHTPCATAADQARTDLAEQDVQLDVQSRSALVDTGLLTAPVILAAGPAAVPLTVQAHKTLGHALPGSLEPPAQVTQGTELPQSAASNDAHRGQGFESVSGHSR